ncbi:hypothetical protein B0H16DRAFT_1312262, partial [Mycena metata]
INTSVLPTFLVAVLSQFYLRRYRPGWFRKYSFLLSAILEGGTQVSISSACSQSFGTDH